MKFKHVLLGLLILQGIYFLFDLFSILGFYHLNLPYKAWNLLSLCASGLYIMFFVHILKNMTINDSYRE